MDEAAIVELTEGWDLSVYRAATPDGRPIDVLAATRAMDCTVGAPVVLDEKYIWIQRVA